MASGWAARAGVRAVSSQASRREADFSSLTETGFFTLLSPFLQLQTYFFICADEKIFSIGYKTLQSVRGVL